MGTSPTHSSHRATSVLQMSSATFGPQQQMVSNRIFSPHNLDEKCASSQLHVRKAFRYSTWSCSDFYKFECQNVWPQLYPQEFGQMCTNSFLSRHDIMHSHFWFYLTSSTSSCGDDQEMPISTVNSAMQIITSIYFNASPKILCNKHQQVLDTHLV